MDKSLIIRLTVNTFRDEAEDDEEGKQDPLYSLIGTIKEVGDDFLLFDLTFLDGGTGTVAIPFSSIAFVDIDDEV